MTIVKSIGVVLLGFFTVAFLSVVTDLALEQFGVIASSTDPRATTDAMLLFALFYRSIYTILGGYLTAKFAPNRPMKHVRALVVLGALGGIGGAIGGWDLGHHWYTVLLAVTGPFFVWLGGKAQTYVWEKSYEVTTRECTKEQLWKLFTDVNHWHVWNKEIRFAKLEGKFEAGNHYVVQGQKGPLVKVELLETIPNSRCIELGKFPLARMYYDHILEETPNGLKVINTITVKGILGFLWVRLVVKNIAATMPGQVQEQIQVASTL